MRNLSVELRPRKFEDFVGCEHITGPITEGIKQGRVDSTYMFFGPPGCGKTSMARVLAWYLSDITEGLDIIEPDTGSLSADDVRQLVASARFAPWTGKYKFIILDEAQKISSAAQEILLKALEEPCDTTVWMICSSDPGKLSEAIKRRGANYIMPSLNEVQIGVLVGKLNILTKGPKDLKLVELAEALYSANITSPGFIVRAYEKLLTGCTVEDSVLHLSQSSEVNAFDIAKAAAAGNWAVAKDLLIKAPISAARDIRGKTASYFKSILLKEPAGSARALRCVWAIKTIGDLANQNQFEDGLIFASTIAAIHEICNGQREYLLKRGKSEVGD